MKNNTFIAIILLFVILIACGNRTNNANDIPIKTGIYTNGGHDVSYLLKITIVDDKFVAEFLEADGMLPPKDFLSDFTFVEMKNFKIDSENLEFTSDSGNGRFEQKEGFWTIVFNDKINELDEPLELMYDSQYD